jgi:hypothetical protein
MSDERKSSLLTESFAALNIRRHTFQKAVSHQRSAFSEQPVLAES